jgi:hypothetical protein
MHNLPSARKQEMYEDGVIRKGKSVVWNETPSPQPTLEEMIDCLLKAGYEVYKRSDGARG